MVDTMDLARNLISLCIASVETCRKKRTLDRLIDTVLGRTGNFISLFTEIMISLTICMIGLSPVG